MGNEKDERIWGVLVYLLSIIGIAIVYFTEKKKNLFLMYHVKQSLALFIISLVIGAVGSVIPIVGWFVIMPLGYLFVVVLWILGMINAWKGVKKPLPIIGEYAEKIKL